jgi:hypothetical protein
MQTSKNGGSKGTFNSMFTVIKMTSQGDIHNVGNLFTSTFASLGRFYMIPASMEL